MALRLSRRNVRWEAQRALTGDLSGWLEGESDGMRCPIASPIQGNRVKEITRRRGLRDSRRPTLQFFA